MFQNINHGRKSFLSLKLNSSKKSIRLPSRKTCYVQLTKVYQSKMSNLIEPDLSDDGSRNEIYITINRKTSV
jgi:hypothetical protein